jgi:hypothetical protein
MRSLLILFISFSIVTPLYAVDAPDSKPAANESLGSQLLNDLPTLSPKSPTGASSQPAQQETAQPSVRGPAAEFGDLGEDIGQPSGPLPLVRARQGMQRASSLLAASTKVSHSRAVQQAGAVQKQVVAQLDELIAQLSKQCQGGQCEQPRQSQEQSQRSQPKPSQASKGSARGKSPARDSSDPLNRASAQPADKADIDAVVKDLWGHLPERSREQMLQSFSTEFLPKYELEIEQYYRRLSEEQATNR